MKKAKAIEQKDEEERNKEEIELYNNHVI